MAVLGGAPPCAKRSATGARHKRIVNHHVRNIVRRVIVQQPVVVRAFLRMHIRAAQSSAVNLLTVWQRHILAQMPVAVDDVILQHLHHPVLWHVPLNHLEKFVFQRMHLLLHQHSVCVAHLKWGAFQMHHQQSVTPARPRFAEPDLAFARLRLETHDSRVGWQRRRLRRPMAE